MISCVLEVELADLEPLRKLFGKDGVVAGARTSNAIPDATLELKEVETGVGFLDSTTATLILTYVSAVATNLIASAIYDILKAQVRRLRINEVAVRNSPDKIAAELERAAENSRTAGPETKSADR